MLAIMLIAALAAAADPVPGAPAEPLPKSNPLARAKIISQNPLSITIQHSKWGQDTAFKWAEAHCAANNRAAVYVGGGAPVGTGITSTWRCEKID